MYWCHAFIVQLFNLPLACTAFNLPPLFFDGHAGSTTGLPQALPQARHTSTPGRPSGQRAWFAGACLVRARGPSDLGLIPNTSRKKCYYLRMGEEEYDIMSNVACEGGGTGSNEWARQ